VVNAIDLMSFLIDLIAVLACRRCVLRAPTPLCVRWQCRQFNFIADALDIAFEPLAARKKVVRSLFSIAPPSATAAATCIDSVCLRLLHIVNTVTRTAKKTKEKNSGTFFQGCTFGAFCQIEVWI
jgi:hypothetical protein